MKTPIEFDKHGYGHECTAMFAITSQMKTLAYEHMTFHRTLFGD